KEHYQEIREAGLDAFRRTLVAAAPRFARHLEALTDWHQLSLLTVASSRCRRWHRPGLLLIGGAAHAMAPAAGAGIKYAVEDGVVAANVLAGPLKEGRVRRAELAEVQRRREWPTRFIQAGGSFATKRVLPLLLNARSPEWQLRLARRLLRLPPVPWL